MGVRPKGSGPQQELDGASTIRFGKMPQWQQRQMKEPLCPLMPELKSRGDRQEAKRRMNTEIRLHAETHSPACSSCSGTSPAGSVWKTLTHIVISSFRARLCTSYIFIVVNICIKIICREKKYLIGFRYVTFQVCVITSVPWFYCWFNTSASEE